MDGGDRVRADVVQRCDPFAFNQGVGEIAEGGEMEREGGGGGEKRRGVERGGKGGARDSERGGAEGGREGGREERVPLRASGMDEGGNLMGRGGPYS